MRIKIREVRLREPFFDLKTSNSAARAHNRIAPISTYCDLRVNGLQNIGGFYKGHNISKICVFEEFEEFSLQNALLFGVLKFGRCFKNIHTYLNFILFPKEVLI